jgi:hypothetical protein
MLNVNNQSMEFFGKSKDSSLSGKERSLPVVKSRRLASSFCATGSCSSCYGSEA